MPIPTSKHSFELSSARLWFQEMQISLQYQCMCYHEYVTKCYDVLVCWCYNVLLCATMCYHVCVAMSMLPYYVCHNMLPV